MNNLYYALENYKKDYVVSCEDPNISVGDIISLYKHVYLRRITVSARTIRSEIQDIDLSGAAHDLFLDDDNFFLVDCIGMMTKTNNSKIMILKNKNHYYCHIISRNSMSNGTDFNYFWKVVHKDMVLEYEMFF